MANGNKKQRRHERRNVIQPRDPKTGERSYETDDAQSGKWLSDIFDHSEGGKEAVCSVCTQRIKDPQHRGWGVFPVCTKCKDVKSTTNPNTGFPEVTMEWFEDLGPDPRDNPGIGGDIDDRNAEVYRN